MKGNACWSQDAREPGFIQWHKALCHTLCSLLTLELLSLLGFSATELCTGSFINLLFITPGFCV